MTAPLHCAPKQAMKPKGKVLDRCCGSLLGLAVGDALGVTHEVFLLQAPPTNAARMPAYLAGVQADTLGQRAGINTVDMVGGVPWQPDLDLQAGAWTDDTSMALCLAHCLLQQGGELDPCELMNVFLKWVYDGYGACIGRCIGLGGTIKNALDEFESEWQSRPDEYQRHIQQLAHQRTWQAGNDMRSGNGAIMRMAPAALYWHDDLQKALQTARLQAATTHPTSECIDACAAMADMIVRAVNGASKSEMLQLSAECMVSLNNADVKELFLDNAAWRTKRTKDIITLPGRCLWSLEAALWAVHNTLCFEDAVTAAVKLGGDADTVAAITGQLAGALYGEKQIPSSWLRALAHREQIRERARALALHGSYDSSSMDLQQ